MDRAYDKRECSKKTNYKETVVNNQKETANILKTDNKERRLGKYKIIRPNRKQEKQSKTVTNLLETFVQMDGGSRIIKI